MASLYFNYSTMNAGKSSSLLQAAHNYEERGMRVLLLKPAIDTRDTNKISSRVGLSRLCTLVGVNEDMLKIVLDNEVASLGCILIDEAQFLSAEQVKQLARIVDGFKIPVMCYGLRTDFMGNLFEGSKALFELADKIQEHKTICHCGSKATMVLRINENGEVLRRGQVVQAGGNESYMSVCRKHYMEGVYNGYNDHDTR